MKSREGKSNSKQDDILVVQPIKRLSMLRRHNVRGLSNVDPNLVVQHANGQDLCSFLNVLTPLFKAPLLSFAHMRRERKLMVHPWVEVGLRSDYYRTSMSLEFFSTQAPQRSPHAVMIMWKAHVDVPGTEATNHAKAPDASPRLVSFPTNNKFWPISVTQKNPPSLSLAPFFCRSNSRQTSGSEF